MVQVCDLFSREDLNDALQFSKDGTFSFSLEVPNEAVPTVYEDAGICAVGDYLMDYAIDKRVHHVHPNRVNWSCDADHRITKNRITDTMRRYAITDARVPADMLGIGRADLIKMARLEPSRTPSGFFSDHLYKFFEELAVRGIDNCGIRGKVDAARENNERKMVQETRHRKFTIITSLIATSGAKRASTFPSPTTIPLQKMAVFTSSFIKPSRPPEIHLSASPISSQQVSSLSGILNLVYIP